jgi:hypothetical protein
MLFAATARPGGVLAAVAGLAGWVAGEDFGQMLTGMATNAEHRAAAHPARRGLLAAAADGIAPGPSAGGDLPAAQRTGE